MTRAFVAADDLSWAKVTKNLSSGAYFGSRRRKLTYMVLLGPYGRSAQPLGFKISSNPNRVRFGLEVWDDLMMMLPASEADRQLAYQTKARVLSDVSFLPLIDLTEAHNILLKRITEIQFVTVFHSRTQVSRQRGQNYGGT